MVKKATCIVPGCKGATYNAGVCSAHWKVFKYWYFCNYEERYRMGRAANPAIFSDWLNNLTITEKGVKL